MLCFLIFFNKTNKITINNCRIFVPYNSWPLNCHVGMSTHARIKKKMTRNLQHDTRKLFKVYKKLYTH